MVNIGYGRIVMAFEDLDGTAIVSQSEVFTRIDAHAARDKVLSNFLMGKLSYKQVAKALGVSEGDVFEYLREAFMRRENPLANADVPQLLDVLRGLVGRMEERTSEWLSQPISTENYKPLTGMIRELRGLVKDIADAEHKLTAGPDVDIQQMTIVIEDMSKFLMTDLCSECRTKAVNVLRNQTAKTVEAEARVVA